MTEQKPRIASLEAELAQVKAERDEERDLYALLRGICEDVIDWIGRLSHDLEEDPWNHPLTVEIKQKLGRMYQHPLDDKLLRRTDELESAERLCRELAVGLEKIAAQLSISAAPDDPKELRSRVLRMFEALLSRPEVVKLLEEKS